MEPGGFTFKTHMSHFITMTLQLHNSLGNQARELFKCLKDAATLLAWTLKKLASFGVFFAGDIISGVSSGHFSSGYLALAPTTRGNFLSRVSIGN